jgi:hypothetical protein
VNAKILILNGKYLERGPVSVKFIVKHTPFISSYSLPPTYGPMAFPNEIVIKQFSNINPKNIMPRISELNSDEMTKKLTKINGANRNPT